MAVLHPCRHEAAAKVSSHAPVCAEDGEDGQDINNNEP